MTPAVVLHAFDYGDTSRILRLLTRDCGVQSVIARGARRSVKRFANLDPLTEGTAHFYVKHGRDLHTLAGFDGVMLRRGLAQELMRFSTAMLLAELIMRFSPAEPDTGLYDLFVHQLDLLMTATGEQLELLSIAGPWQLVASLGFSPSLAHCARDGAELPRGAARFSIVDGGFLCRSCSAGARLPELSREDRSLLEKLVGGSLADVAAPGGRHLAAHRRLFARFATRHVAEGRELSTLELWETPP